MPRLEKCTRSTVGLQRAGTHGSCHKKKELIQRARQVGHQKKYKVDVHIASTEVHLGIPERAPPITTLQA